MRITVTHTQTHTPEESVSCAGSLGACDRSSGSSPEQRRPRVLSRDGTLGTSEQPGLTSTSTQRQPPFRRLLFFFLAPSSSSRDRSLSCSSPEQFMKSFHGFKEIIPKDKTGANAHVRGATLAKRNRFNTQTLIKTKR